MENSRMKTSLVITVYNEALSIERLLSSIKQQILKPEEVIIVDAFSKDDTCKIISAFSKKDKQLNIKLLKKRGNRSIGRNEGIKKAKNKIITITDAGCFLDKKWLLEITKPFHDKKVDVVAGYYSSKTESIFQKCLVPYVLVMPDKINKSFLPATRSMAFKKTIWKKVGGFPVKYSHNEDYVFANKLKKIKANIIFNKKSVVYWIPRNNLTSSFKMFFRFALGDAEARIFRIKVLLIFLRYLIAFILLLLFLKNKLFLDLYILIFLVIAYILWSILKNYKYVKSLKALYLLPLLQIVSDIAVISGSVCGFLKSLIN